MNKNCTSFFMIVLCVPLLIYPMNQPYNSIKIIIPVSGAHSIEFIGNEEVIINKIGKEPKIISIESEERRPFLKDFIFQTNWHMATDKAKKKIIFGRRAFTSWFMNIYDSAVQNGVFSHNLHCNTSDKAWGVSLDEKRPASVLISKDNSIVSYNYWNGAEYSDDCLSEVFREEKLHNSTCGFNKRVGNYIVDQCDQGFTIFFNSPDSVHYQKVLYEVPFDNANEKNYLCSSDMSFIAYYDVYGTNSSCSVFNIKTGKNINLCDENGLVAPCAMEIHPNNEVIITMATGNRLVQYWQASTGILLWEHESPDVVLEEQETGYFKKYLALSAHGKYLAAVGWNLITISHVPIEALCGMTRNQLIFVVWCLRHLPVPKDVAHLIFDALQY